MSPLSQHMREHVKDGAARQAAREAQDVNSANVLRSMSSVHAGHCGITQEGDPGDCREGSNGVLAGNVRTLKECVALCNAEQCPRCSWVSFTTSFGGDCSWYARCDGPSTEPYGATHRSVHVRAPLPMPEVSASERAGDRTLIVLVYHASSSRRSMGVRASSQNSMTSSNLEFFVRNGIAPALRNPRYTFVIANSGRERITVPLPQSPRLVVHDLNGSQGYEFINYKRYFCGDSAPTYQRCAPPLEYRHFILLPDTVRGPFTPNYVPASTWPDLLTSQLSDRVKLVGPSVNSMYCHNSLAQCRRGLHVQGFMLATDRIGLHTLLRHWRRPGGKGDSIMHNEVGMTAKIVGAGYNVAVLQRFWRDHDFHDYTLTQRKCRLLTSRAKGGTNGANTSLGLPACQGCQWGDTDLSPWELLFAHRSITENFQQGPAVAYTDMGDELQRLAEPQ